MTNKSIRDYINLIENLQREGVAEGQDQEVTHNGEVIGHTWNQGREVHGEHTKSGMSWAGGNHASMTQHLKNHHASWVKDQARKQSLKKQGVAEVKAHDTNHKVTWMSNSANKAEHFDSADKAKAKVSALKKSGQYHNIKYTPPKGVAEGSQKPNNTLEAIVACFDAAEAEGLQEVLANTQDDRLKDLVERRLMHALYYAQDALKKQGVAEEQLEENTPDALSKIDELFRDK